MAVLAPLRRCRCGRRHRSWADRPCRRCVAETLAERQGQPLGLRKIQRARQAEHEARLKGNAA